MTSRRGICRLEIRFYGHACIYYQDEHVSLAIDPWFSKSGAFLSSWFQFPDNTDLDLEPIRNADYIVLSHEHQDHVDLNFLKTVSPKTKIIIPKFTDSYLLRLLSQNLSNEIQILDSKAKTSLAPGRNLCLVVQSVPIWDDCSIIFETPDATLLDVNDMKITGSDLDWIRNNFEIHYLFMQFAPSAWHPHIYDYDDQKKSRLLAHKTQTRFGYAKDTFHAIRARKFIPSAGPPCFLDGLQFENAFLSEYVFSALPQFYRYAFEHGFANSISILMPGDRFLPDADYGAINEEILKKQAYSDPRNYLQIYRKKREATIERELQRFEAPAESLLEKCKQHFEPLISSSP